jgi:hypothetical protein
MPAHEIAFPVGSYNIYPPVPVVNRSGKDGNVPVARIFAGDNFVGESLEGHWKKESENNPAAWFTAKLNAGSVELNSRSSAAGTYQFAWLNSQLPFPMLQDSYIDVHLEVPAVTPTYEIFSFFVIAASSGEADYRRQSDLLEVWLSRSTGGANNIRVRKEVGGTSTFIYARSEVTNNEGTFRIKFRPTDAKIDVYFHDGSGAVVEGSDKLTLTDDTYDLDFDIGYPALEVAMAETTERVVISDGITVNIPDSGFSYRQPPADKGKGDAKVYDQMGTATESDWHRVYSNDHDYAGDMVIENGLIRLIIDEAANNGLKLYHWTGSAYVQYNEFLLFRLDDDAVNCTVPHLDVVHSVTPESVSVRVRMTNTSSPDDSNNILVDITMERGRYHIEADIEEANPKQDIRLMFYDTTNRRFQYLGDNFVGDADLTISGSNTVMTDNFMMAVDDAGPDFIPYVASNEKPTTSFYSYQGSYLAFLNIDVLDFPDLKLYIGVMPFSDIDDLVRECEIDGSGVTTNAPDDVSDGTASGGNKLQLDALNEYWQYIWTTDNLPAGRYRFIIRAKDSNQVADDFGINAYNQTDSVYISEDQGIKTFTLTGSWAYYSVIFEINADDSGDTLRVNAKKMTAGANTIDIDHILIVPLGNGESFPQDLAHSEMRSKAKNFRLMDATTYQVFAGVGLGYGIPDIAYTDAMAVAAVESVATLTATGAWTIGSLTLTTIPAGTADYDKFLVSDSGVIKYRTGAEVLSDIGAAATGHDFDTHSGNLDLVDIGDYGQGKLIRGGASDWEALALGTQNYVLKAGASNFSWGQVDFSEITGTLPSHGESVHTGDILPDADQTTANSITIGTNLTIFRDLLVSSTTGNLEVAPNSSNRTMYGVGFPSGTQDESAWRCANASDQLNYGLIGLRVNGATAYLEVGEVGTGTKPTQTNVLSLGDPIDICGSITVDASGHVTKIGQSTHTTDYFLKWDGAKAVWASAPGTIGGSGTVNTLARFVTDTTTIGNSMVSQNAAGTQLTVGTIVSGTWQGSAISNTYISGLNQNCTTGSTPTFAGVNITGGPSLSGTGLDMNTHAITELTNITMTGHVRFSGTGSASGTDGYCTMGEYADGVQFFEPTAGSQGGSAFRIYTQLSPNGWIIDTSTGDNIFFGESIFPVTSATGEDIGSASHYWDDVYADAYYYKTAPTSFDHLDDLAILETMHSTKEGQLNLEEVPEEVYTKDEFVNYANMQGFIIGATRQLYLRFKEQEKLVAWLIDEVERLKEDAS